MRVDAVRSQRQVRIESLPALRDLCGPGQSHLHLLETRLADYALKAESAAGGIRLEGYAPGPEIAMEALTTLSRHIDAGAEAPLRELDGIVGLLRGGAPADPAPIVCSRSKVRARSAGQCAYARDLRDKSNELLFAIGPAGTGKTHLAVAAGVESLESGACGRLVLARPALEAGERLGFLPGDLEDKTDPYMLPVIDSLNALMGAEELAQRKRRGEVECAPLAYMRGRTFNRAFIIVDEAQNATVAQMRMVLTRLGADSRMVIAGDPTQTDLPDPRTGLDHAVAVLSGLKGVCVSRLSSEDVVRHRLVADIVRVWQDEG